MCDDITVQYFYIFQSSLGQEDTQVFYVYSKDSKSISLPEIEMGNENCKKEGYIHIFDMAIYFWIKKMVKKYY